MARRIIFRVLLVLAILSVLIYPSTASAIVPPTVPTLILTADAYQDVLELNDMLVIAEYQITYASAPYEPVNQAYIARLMNGNTELGSIAPYADYYFQGYRRGVISFYFSALSAPVWNQTYTVKLQGNPTLVWVGGIPSYPLDLTGGTGVWHTSVDQSNTRIMVAQKIRLIAADMQLLWNNGVVLVSGTPPRLTPDQTNLISYQPAGITYFSNAVPNLSLMCPDLFASAFSNPVIIVKSYNTTYSDQLENRWKTTPVFKDIMYANLFGLTPMLWKSILWFAGMFGLSLWISSKLADKKPVWFISFPCLFVGILLGMVPLNLGGLVAGGAFLGVGFLIFWHD